jgi:hypothetical protein
MEQFGSPFLVCCSLRFLHNNSPFEKDSIRTQVNCCCVSKDFVITGLTIFLNHEMMTSLFLLSRLTTHAQPTKTKGIFVISGLVRNQSRFQSFSFMPGGKESPICFGWLDFREKVIPKLIELTWILLGVVQSFDIYIYLYIFVG